MIFYKVEKVWNKSRPLQIVEHWPNMDLMQQESIGSRQIRNPKWPLQKPEEINLKAFIISTHEENNNPSSFHEQMKPLACTYKKI